MGLRLAKPLPGAGLEQLRFCGSLCASGTRPGGGATTEPPREGRGTGGIGHCQMPVSRPRRFFASFCTAAKGTRPQAKFPSTVPKLGRAGGWGHPPLRRGTAASGQRRAHTVRPYGTTATLYSIQQAACPLDQDWHSPQIGLYSCLYFQQVKTSGILLFAKYRTFSILHPVWLL